jgi:hypothetical protein
MQHIGIVPEHNPGRQTKTITFVHLHAALLVLPATLSEFSGHWTPADDQPKNKRCGEG